MDEADPLALYQLYLQREVLLRLLFTSLSPTRLMHIKNRDI